MYEERLLLREKEIQCFRKFLDRCKRAHDGSLIGTLCNPFEEVTCLERKNEKLQQTAQNLERSTQSCEQQEPDLVALYKYRPD